MRNNGFFPIRRWFAGLVLLFGVYVVYSFTGDIIENDLVDVGEDMGIHQYAMTVIRNTGTNYWYGILILSLGILGYLVLAGMPGQTEERWQGYI